MDDLRAGGDHCRARWRGGNRASAKKQGRAQQSPRRFFRRRLPDIWRLRLEAVSVGIGFVEGILERFGSSRAGCTSYHVSSSLYSSTLPLPMSSAKNSRAEANALLGGFALSDIELLLGAVDFHEDGIIDAAGLEQPREIDGDFFHGRLGDGHVHAMLAVDLGIELGLVQQPDEVAHAAAAVLGQVARTLRPRRCDRARDACR